MKRYLLFSGSTYYPAGGMDDFQGDFTTLEAARRALAEKVTEDWDNPLSWPDDWGHIYDTVERRIIEQYPQRKKS